MHLIHTHTKTFYKRYKLTVRSTHFRKVGHNQGDALFPYLVIPLVLVGEVPWKVPFTPPVAHVNTCKCTSILFRIVSFVTVCPLTTELYVRRRRWHGSTLALMY